MSTVNRNLLRQHKLQVRPAVLRRKHVSTVNRNLLRHHGAQLQVDHALLQYRRDAVLYNTEKDLSPFKRLTRIVS
jgi:hypothetical protein